MVSGQSVSVLVVRGELGQWGSCRLVPSGAVEGLQRENPWRWPEVGRVAMGRVPTNGTARSAYAAVLRRFLNINGILPNPSLHPALNNVFWVVGISSLESQKIRDLFISSRASSSTSKKGEQGAMKTSKMSCLRPTKPAKPAFRGPPICPLQTR